MKYKIGDKVKMRKGHFGHDVFYSEHNYVLTIKDYDGYIYLMEEDEFFWYLEASIKGLYVEEIFDPIENRWDILDIRKDG